MKVNAFLEQEMGFRNTKKLQDGIVGYFRHRQEAGDNAEAPNKWRGQNFVFDHRELVELEPNQEDPS